MAIEYLVLLIIITYGTNGFLYFKFKGTEISLTEKIAVYFGVNMTLLLIDGLLLFFAKATEEGLVIF